MLQIGQTIELGWNGAKYLGDSFLSHSEVRVEAVGIDWIVVRDNAGRPWSATFEQGDDFKKELEA